MEALDVAIFPGRARLDVNGLDLVFSKPVLDRVGDELWPVVAPNMLRSSVALDGAFNDGNDIDRADRPGDVHRQALTRELIDQSENAKTRSILCLVFHKIPTPDVVGMGGTLALGCRQARSPHLPLLLAHLQPMVATHALHSLGVDQFTLPAH